MQAFNDSGLQFAEGSHRDVALHYLHPGKAGSLEGRGYRIASVGETQFCYPQSVLQGPLQRSQQHRATFAGILDCATRKDWAFEPDMIGLCVDAKC